MQDDLTNDELLDVPLANLRPGELRRAFVVQAAHVEKAQEAEVVRSRTTSELQRSQEEETNHEHEEAQRREETLLIQLDQRDQELMEQAERLDARAIKLDDGRRVYVDKDKYRDAEGRELTGADRAQAELLHLEHPDAATWQEHQEIQNEFEATERLRRKVETLQANGDAGDGSKLTAYEAEFQSRVVARQQAGAKAADSMDTDYMAAYGLSGGFRQAATGTPPLPATSPAATPAPPKATVPAF